MKIKSSEFLTHKKVALTFKEKGNPILESIYLDFGDRTGTGYAYFGSKEGMGRIRFYFTPDSGETIPNFFINTEKFIAIMEQHDDEVSLNEKFVFSHGKDKYRIATIVDDDQINTKLFNTQYDECMVFNKDSLDKLRKAVSFINKDDGNTNFIAVFIQDGYICGMSSRTPLYESKIDFPGVEVNIPLFVANTILQVGADKECLFHYKKGLNSKRMVSNDGELEMIIPNCSNLDFPSNRQPSFIQSYAHDLVLKVNTVDFTKTIQSLEPYFNDVLNAKIRLSIADDLSLTVDDKTTNVERFTSYVEASDGLKGKEYFISGTKLLQVLGVLKEKELFLAFPNPEGGPIINFYNDDNSHCLITRFKE